MSGADPEEGDQRFHVAVLGGGSAAEALTRELDGSGLSIVVFEPRLVGGECPFLACMPSKSLLHDADQGTSWAEAVDRRDAIVQHLDDAAHAEDLADLGVTLVRDAARIVGDGIVRAAGVDHPVDHVIIATGSTERRLQVDGVDTCDQLVRTSADALTTQQRPARLVVVGGGVIGIETSFVFAGLGSDVTLIDPGDRPFDRVAPAVSEIVGDALAGAGVDVQCGRGVDAMARDGDTVVVQLSNGGRLVADRVLVAIGRHPDTAHLGLETIGVDGADPLPLEPNGRLRCAGSVWAIGDASGHGQYTHLANHHARVVADHLVGTGTRRFDDVTQVGCLFSWPPVIEVGPSFDELVHAIVVAVDGAVPVARLRMSMRPFPTIGEILGPILDELHARLVGR